MLIGFRVKDFYPSCRRSDVNGGGESVNEVNRAISETSQCWRILRASDTVRLRRTVRTAHGKQGLGLSSKGPVRDLIKGPFGCTKNCWLCFIHFCI
jgi:hypothetical protein